MVEFYKIDKSRIKAIGVTVKRSDEDEVALILPERDMPPDCFVLFVDKDYWLEIRERIYA